MRHGLCLSLPACRQVRDPFSVRVMVPCYKEDIETLNDTLTAAVKAAKLAMDANMANAGQLQQDPLPAWQNKPYVVPGCMQ